MPRSSPAACVTATGWSRSASNSSSTARKCEQLKPAAPHRSRRRMGYGQRSIQEDRAMQLSEPTLREALADPIVQAVMLADGVDPRELEAMLTRVVAQLPARRGI